MMLNDNIIDCFLDGSSNIIESNPNTVNIKYTEIMLPIEKNLPIEKDLPVEKVLSDEKDLPLEKQEKLNKNKILDYNLNYNGYHTIGNVKPNKSNRDCKNTRDNPTRPINDDIRSNRIKRNNLSKQK